MIRDPGGLLRPHEALLRDTINAALTRAVQVLPMTGLTITVSPNASRAIHAFGWTRPQAIAYMAENTGFRDGPSTAETDRIRSAC